MPPQPMELRLRDGTDGLSHLHLLPSSLRPSKSPFGPWPSPIWALNPWVTWCHCRTGGQRSLKWPVVSFQCATNEMLSWQRFTLKRQRITLGKCQAEWVGSQCTSLFLACYSVSYTVIELCSHQSASGLYWQIKGAHVKWRIIRANEKKNVMIICCHIVISAKITDQVSTSLGEGYGRLKWSTEKKFIDKVCKIKSGNFFWLGP